MVLVFADIFITLLFDFGFSI